MRTLIGCEMAKVSARIPLISFNIVNIFWIKFGSMNAQKRNKLSEQTSGILGALSNVSCSLHQRRFGRANRA